MKPIQTHTPSGKPVSITRILPTTPDAGHRSCPDCGLSFYEDEDRIITSECICGWTEDE